MPFWSSAQTAATKDPKRKFRFTVTITSLEGSYVWYAKTATKPSFSIASTEHKYLNHTFYYPGTVTWNDVTITLVDPVEGAQDVTQQLANILTNSGYRVPTQSPTPRTVTKGAAVSAMSSVIIRQIDGAGQTLEEWTLNNPWVTDAKFGDLEYGSDDLTEISLTLKYDWASLNNTSFTLNSADPAATP